MKNKFKPKKMFVLLFVLTIFMIVLSMVAFSYLALSTFNYNMYVSIFYLIMGFALVICFTITAVDIYNNYQEYKTFLYIKAIADKEYKALKEKQKQAQATEPFEEFKKE